MSYTNMLPDVVFPSRLALEGESCCASQMYAEHGWRVHNYTTRKEMVVDFQLDPRLMSNVMPPAKGCNALFIVATPVPNF